MAPITAELDKKGDAASQRGEAPATQVLDAEARLSGQRGRHDVGGRLAGAGGGHRLGDGHVDGQELRPVHPAEGDQMAGAVHDRDVPRHAHLLRPGRGRSDDGLGLVYADGKAAYHDAIP